jgi:hypothetical protein
MTEASHKTPAQSLCCPQFVLYLLPAILFLFLSVRGTSDGAESQATSASFYKGFFQLFQGFFRKHFVFQNGILAVISPIPRTLLSVVLLAAFRIRATSSLMEPALLARCEFTLPAGFLA